jgi:hypothetical protein
LKVRPLSWLIAVTVAGLALYILAWQWDLIPRDEIAAGTVTLPDGRTLKTRQFYRTSRQDTHKSPAPGPLTKTAAWEVELPSGRWIDCGGSCAEAARRALN